jgi:nucleotide-binding universal stress UspA family protein
MTEQHREKLLQPVRHILACLDLTQIDPVLIGYAAFLARTLETRRVSFFHAIQAYDLPDRASKKFPDVETELKSMVLDEIRQSVDSSFESDCQWDIVTRVGYEDAAQEVVDYIQDRGIDLTLIGQKYGENRQARYSQKIASQAKSDILFVTPDAESSDSPILCAIDFSRASVRAFELCLDLSRSWGVELMCYFVSDPTRAYFPATTDRSSSHARGQSRKAFEKFLQGYGLSPEQVPCRIEIDGSMSSAAEDIYQAALDEGAGLIVVGAQGDTTKVTSLLGNLCESFRLMKKEVPVMIVKQETRKKFPWFWKAS